MELVYKYEFGNECVVGTSITLYKNNNIYDLIVVQYSFEEKFMATITSDYNIISENSVTEEMTTEYSMLKKTIKMKIEANLNPPPEKVFTLVD